MPRIAPAAEEALSLAREVGGPGALAEAALTASRARQQSGDLGGAQAVLDEIEAELDPARMTVQREAITLLETRRSEVAFARGDRAVARTSATTAVRLAPKRHVEARVEALLALASVDFAEERPTDAQRLIEEASALAAPTDYRDLQERTRRMTDELTARPKAR